MTDERDFLRGLLEDQIRGEMAGGATLDQAIEAARVTDPAELERVLRQDAEREDAEFRAVEREQAEKRRRLVGKWRKHAELAFLIGKIDDAERSAQRILELAPGDLDALNRLGHIAQRRGRLDEALGRKEGMASKLGSLGVIAEQRGDSAEARWL